MKQLLFLILMMVGVAAYSQEWKTNFEEAKKEALVQNKKILLVFSGSDWCGPCIKLDKNVWQSEEFKSYASTNYVLVRADFPKKKTNQLALEVKNQNLLLAEKYNKEGFFPLVVLLNSSDKVLGKMGFENCSSTEYLKKLQNLEK